MALYKLKYYYYYYYHIKCQCTHSSGSNAVHCSIIMRQEYIQHRKTTLPVTVYDKVIKANLFEQFATGPVQGIDVEVGEVVNRLLPLAAKCHAQAVSEAGQMNAAVGLHQYVACLDVTAHDTTPCHSPTPQRSVHWQHNTVITIRIIVIQIKPQSTT